MDSYGPHMTHAQHLRGGSHPRPTLCVAAQHAVCRFSVWAAGGPGQKVARVARRARAEEVPLDVATWPCRACDVRSELACLEPAARIGLLLACSLALSVLLPALFIISPSSHGHSQCPSDWPPTGGSFPNRALGPLG